MCVVKRQSPIREKGGAPAVSEGKTSVMREKGNASAACGNGSGGGDRGTWKYGRVCVYS